MKAPNLTMKPVAWLKPYEKNAKLHPADEVKKLATTIKRFGWDQPIVAEADGTIIKGHGRRLAAIELGMVEVPVLIRDDLTKAEADAARIADNMAFGMRYDTKVMQDELKRLLDEMPELDLNDLAMSQKDKDLLTSALDQADMDSIMVDTLAEIEKQKSEDQRRIDAADAEQVPLAKVFGFKTISKSDERVVVEFIAQAEFTSGKTGPEALIAGMREYIRANA